MSRLPKVTQKNVHLFIPYKAAYVANRLAQEEHISITEALLAFYCSRTYAQLEREDTKRWQENAKQLYTDFREEKPLAIPPSGKNQ